MKIYVAVYHVIFHRRFSKLTRPIVYVSKPETTCVSVSKLSSVQF